AMQACETVELRLERGAIAHEVAVLVGEQGDARPPRRVEDDAGRGAHRRDQRPRHPGLAAFFFLALDVHGTRGLERGKLVQELALEPLLRGLRPVRKVAQHRAAMSRQRLEVEHLHAGAAQGAEEAALAASRRAMNYFEQKILRK